MWEYLTFWTAIGSLALGGLLGLTFGLVAKELKRLSLPPDAPLPHQGICPSCGNRSLRRLRCRPSARILVILTRRWPYGCPRCGWRSSLPTPKRRRAPVHRRPDPALATIIDGEPIVTAREKTPIREREKIVARPREPIVNHEQRPPLPPARDDLAEVRAAVLKHLEALNAGDADARAKYTISESTSFGFDNSPMADRGNRSARAARITGQLRNLRFRDLRINIHKDAAVATGYLVGTIVLPGGGTRPITGRSTWVHVRQNGSWKIAHSHMSPLRADVAGSLS